MNRREFLKILGAFALTATGAGLGACTPGEELPTTHEQTNQENSTNPERVVLQNNPHEIMFGLALSGMSKYSVSPLTQEETALQLLWETGLQVKGEVPVILKDTEEIMQFATLRYGFRPEHPGMYVLHNLNSSSDWSWMKVAVPSPTKPHLNALLENDLIATRAFLENAGYTATEAAEMVRQTRVVINGTEYSALLTKSFGLNLKVMLKQGVVSADMAAMYYKQAISQAIELLHTQRLFHPDAGLGNVVVTTLPNGQSRGMMIDFTGIHSTPDADVLFFEKHLFEMAKNEAVENGFAFPNTLQQFKQELVAAGKVLPEFTPGVPPTPLAFVDDTGEAVMLANLLTPEVPASQSIPNPLNAAENLTVEPTKLQAVETTIEVSEQNQPIIRYALLRQANRLGKNALKVLSKLIGPSMTILTGVDMIFTLYFANELLNEEVTNRIVAVDTEAQQPINFAQLSSCLNLWTYLADHKSAQTLESAATNIPEFSQLVASLVSELQSWGVNIATTNAAEVIGEAIKARYFTESTYGAMRLEITNDWSVRKTDFQMVALGKDITGQRKILFYGVNSSNSPYLLGIYVEQQDGNWTASNLPMSYGFSYPVNGEPGTGEKKTYQVLPPINNQVSIFRTT